jgi:hypothetical protein
MLLIIASATSVRSRYYNLILFGGYSFAVSATGSPAG